jgi:hypothetical protein
MGINIGKILNAIATGARTAGPLVSLANPLVGGAMVAGGNLLDDEGDFVDRMKRAAIGGGLTFAGGKLAGGGAPRAGGRRGGGGGRPGPPARPRGTGGRSRRRGGCCRACRRRRGSPGRDPRAHRRGPGRRHGVAHRREARREPAGAAPDRAQRGWWVHGGPGGGRGPPVPPAPQRGVGPEPRADDAAHRGLHGRGLLRCPTAASHAR